MALNTKEFAFKAVRLLNEKKAKNIILLDMKNISLLADYFLICNGNSLMQNKALCDHLLDNLPEENFRLLRVEGYQDACWILLDFGILVIHIFMPEKRSFYNLERLWGGAKALDLEGLCTCNSGISSRECE